MSDPTIVVNTDPGLIDYLVAVGTIGAAAFAGWAAITRTAAKAAADLVRIEAGRDQASTEAERWRQALRVVVTMQAQEITTSDGRAGFDCSLAMLNANPEPIRFCRIKMVVGDATWGPHLCGTIGPFERGYAAARLMPSGDRIESMDAFARFVDASGEAWIARSGGGPVAGGDVEEWIEAGRAFGERIESEQLSAEEVGNRGGAFDTMPDLDAWRAGFEADPEA